MAVASTIAWARGLDRWIAVAPVVGLAAGGGLLVGASISALAGGISAEMSATRSAQAHLASWSGELVLRDGRRLRLGGEDGCQMVAEQGFLVLRGAPLDGVTAALWRAARVELAFAAGARGPTCRP